MLAILIGSGHLMFVLSEHMHVLLAYLGLIQYNGLKGRFSLLNKKALVQHHKCMGLSAARGG